ncbi:MAG: glutathione S-transferase family protein [Burkholderiaceae bacterium]|jgi:glutathione S-transferase|nr:glutathione S-transferase family protein [Burkholderiaceae bacterium]
MLKLYIANKNYSSWSMRPWVLMTQAGIGFEEIMAPFGTEAEDFSHEFSAESRRVVGAVSPAGLVPVLVDGKLAVWDSLAIVEYLAERFPGHALWPRDAAQRARARSIVAEMHAGFAALRRRCPMNIAAHLPERGRTALREDAGVRADLARIVAMWSDLLAAHGGPMLFGAFSMADAYYAPVVMRLRTYELPTPPAIVGYAARVQALPGVKAWIDAVLAERTFVPVIKPRRTSR